MNLYNPNEIKPLFERHGFRFSKAMGQNFLIAGWVTERIVECAGIRADSGVLEIGPGIGALSVELVKKAGRLVAVELDRKLIALLHETLPNPENVVLLNENILKTDLRALTERYFKGLEPVVCANLPYNITTPTLTALIDSGCFSKIVVMVQKEVAQRMCAESNTPEYGAFTVYVNYHTITEIQFDVPPDCFMPRPKVTSSVIALTKRKKPEGIISEELFFKTVRAAFAQRRKTLVNALLASFGNKLKKDEIQRVTDECGFNPTVRGEVLGIREFADLSNALYAATR